MKVKRLAAAALAAIITASAITACTNGGENQSASESEASVTVGADGRTKEGIMYTEGLPIVDPGDYEFTIFVDDSNNKDDYIMLPIFEEETGVKVNIERYPFEIAQEKLTLALNSENYADCIGGWTLKVNDILTLGMEEGVYIQLDEIFKKYCPKIEDILNLEGVRDTMTTPDGHIYSVPYAIEAPTSPFNILINTEWLDKLGLEMPATTEEFRTVLKAFKDQDPNGNGEQDEIPFTVDSDNKNLGLLCGWFGMPVNDEGFTPRAWLILSSLPRIYPSGGPRMTRTAMGPKSPTATAARIQRILPSIRRSTLCRCFQAPNVQIRYGCATATELRFLKARW